MTEFQPPFDTDPGYGGDPILNPTDPSPSPAPAPAPSPPPQPPVFAGGLFIPTAPPTPQSAPTELPIPAVVGVPNYAAADYATAAWALMPRGRAWSRDPASVQGRVLGAIGETFERSDAAASSILAGSIPGTLTPLLPEWEASLGLPDALTGAQPSFDDRMGRVRGRFVGLGGQSREAITAYAAALGFIIRITNYSSFRVGQSPVDSPVAGDEWSFVWGVVIVGTTGSLGVDVLLRELNLCKPAETTLVFLGDGGGTALESAEGAPLLGADGTPLLV